MVNLRTTIASLNLENPTILASGIMDEDAGSMLRAFNNGAGAVVTKSIGIKPKPGYPNPTFVELEHGILNAMGLPNPGIDEFGEEIIKLKKSNITVIGSIFGSDVKEFLILAEKMQEYGTDAIELNMSCPHAKGYGLEIGTDPKMLNEITTKVKAAVEIPVFVKISSNVSDIVKIAQAAEDGNADGIVAINSVKAIKIDIEAKMPVLANKKGGYSGKAIKPIGIRSVYDIASKINIPIIGSGGVTTGEDAIEYFMAGATAVQIGSGVYYRGIDIFSKVCKEISTWMENHGYSKMHDIIGVAVQ
ncbi:MAG: dihydroorotate dehydrogenase [Candidatus Thermoplasmatota archaeon]|nr:dihydroorotate dehydrogenase [Candidatus Thermoplasmatota archaeon]